MYGMFNFALFVYMYFPVYFLLIILKYLQDPFMCKIVRYCINATKLDFYKISIMDDFYFCIFTLVYLKIDIFLELIVNTNLYYLISLLTYGIFFTTLYLRCVFFWKKPRAYYLFFKYD